MSDLPVPAPQHALRPASEVLEGLRSHLGQLRQSVAQTWELAALVDSDLLEIRERQLYKTAWGYTSFADFCYGELGVSASWIRARIARAARSQELMLNGPKVADPGEVPPKLYRRTGALLPNPPPGRATSYQGTQPTGRRRRRAIPVESVETVDRALEVLVPEAEPEPEEEAAPAPPPANPLIAWLCQVLDQLSPADVVAHATDEQAAQIIDWMDRFIDAGTDTFCEHHPNARSEDGKTCEACGKVVKR